MDKIERGARFFWNPSIYPYYIKEENAEYIIYKRYQHGSTKGEEYADKKVYRSVFEDAIKSGEIEFK
jgi:hypothetical protein